MPEIFVDLLPEFLDGTSLSETTAVVIDILRASTTIVHALGNGAQAVFPCLTVEEAVTASQVTSTDLRRLGGERHGTRIPGFDFGNSPFEYTSDVIRHKVLYFTTTNGTRALHQARTAGKVYIGAFSNRSALVKCLLDDGRTVHLVCAGTDNRLTPEDILFAGAVTSDLLASSSEWKTGNMEARMAADYFNARNSDSNEFRRAFIDGSGAQNLLELGMERDIDRALQNDLFHSVPCWNAETGQITITES